MTRVLVADDDQGFSSAIARDLSAHAFEVTTVSSVADAVKVLATEPIDVVVTDLRMGDKDGIDLLESCRATSARARTILMSAYASARDYDTAIELGAVRVLCKPFTPRELIDAIREAAECESGFHGNIHGLSLVDILQMFHYGRRNATILIGGTRGGKIHVEGGEIVHAECGELAGEPALAAVLATRSGSVRTTVSSPADRTIARAFESVLLDALRVVDESRKGGSIPPNEDDWGFDETPSMPLDPWSAARTAVGRLADDVAIAAFDTTSSEIVTLAGKVDEVATAFLVHALLDLVASEPEVSCECFGQGVAAAIFRGPRRYGVAILGSPRDAKGRSWFRAWSSSLAARVLELAPEAP